MFFFNTLILYCALLYTNYFTSFPPSIFCTVLYVNVHAHLNTQQIRVGNSLISFSSKSLVFCERKNKREIFSWKRANGLLYERATGAIRSRSLSVKSEEKKSNGSDSLLGIKKGEKTVKNCQKPTKNRNFVERINNMSDFEQNSEFPTQHLYHKCLHFWQAGSSLTLALFHRWRISRYRREGNCRRCCLGGRIYSKV